ncbi:MAG: Flp family type IVb pilin [Marmoricola sp.]
MLNFFRTILSRRTDDGASAVEYGLLVAGIAALIVVVVFALGGFVKGAFSSTCTAMSGNVSSATPSTAC